jgi:agmatine deiminase
MLEDTLLWPAEWEPHAATWLAWPHQKADWPGKFYPIPWVWCEIVRWISRVEKVRLLVPAGQTKAISTMLNDVKADLKQVELLEMPTDRVWLRDSGGQTVRVAGGGRALVRWKFNAWAKYRNHKKDAQIAGFMAKHLGLEEVQAFDPAKGTIPLVLEGGSIDADGEGTLLTTEECLLSKVQERNKCLDRAGYEMAFKRYLGIQHTIWLKNGIVGDDTHGHVDDLARFVGPGRVVCAREPNQSDPNHGILEENIRRLNEAKDAKGRRLEVIDLPMPEPVEFQGQRLPASYANFYIANDLVLVPTFNDPSDRLALGLLAELFPGRRLVGIHAVDLVWGLGTLHCLSQQESA